MDPEVYNNILKYISYSPVNVAQRNSGYLLRETYETHRDTVCAELRVIECLSWWYMALSLCCTVNYGAVIAAKSVNRYCVLSSSQERIFMKIAINVKAVYVTIRVTESFTRFEIENSVVTLCLSNALDSGFILRCVTVSLYCVYV